MENFENYFVKALHDAKVRHLEESLTTNGFVVRAPEDRDDAAFDLVAENPKDGQVRAYEVKVLPLGEAARAQIDRLLERAKHKHYDFRLVTIARPTKYSIAIDWLDEALLEYITDPNHALSELDSLSTHTQVEDVRASIRSISIEGENANVVLGGTINVTLQYGSGSDQAKGNGWERSESVPFDGKAILDLPSKSIKTAEIQVDLDAW